MSDYTQRVREFAQLNPGLWVAEHSSPEEFTRIARLLEHEQALGFQVTESLRLGENVRDPHSAMAAVAERARVARRLAAERGNGLAVQIERAERGFGLDPTTPDPGHHHQGLRQRIAARTHQQPTRQGVER